MTTPTTPKQRRLAALTISQMAQELGGFITIINDEQDALGQPWTIETVDEYSNYLEFCGETLEQAFTAALSAQGWTPAPF